jgi:hypothetical protein
MKPKVYIETSVISYLTARPSGNLVVAGHQKTTHDWWHLRRPDFEAYVSDFVLDEVSAGDEGAALRRRQAVRDLTVLELTEESRDLAHRLVVTGLFPEKAAGDAFHLAIAIVSGMDYLLTWNCTHIANARVRKPIEELAASLEFEAPVICTPDELMED